MRPSFILLLLAAAGCAETPGSAARADTVGSGPGAACRTSADCPADQWCLHQRCSPRGGSTAPEDPVLLPSLSASPVALNFGVVAPPSTRRLAVVVSNEGPAMATLYLVRILPEGAPFRVEPMGYGPFWIRPGRSRELFVSYAPTTPGHHDATLLVPSEAPELVVSLIGD